MSPKKKPTPSNKNKPISSITKIQTICSTLETIAKSYSKRSKEYKAIEEATFAIIFLEQHKMLKTAYTRFLKNNNRQLTPQEKKIFKDSGVLN